MLYVAQLGPCQQNSHHLMNITHYTYVCTHVYMHDMETRVCVSIIIGCKERMAETELVNDVWTHTGAMFAQCYANNMGR